MDDPDDIEYEEIIHTDENINKSITEFLSNYEKIKKNNKSSPFLTIYEKTRIQKRDRRPEINSNNLRNSIPFSDWLVE